MVSLPDDTQADISDAFNTAYRQLDEILNINEPVHEIRTIWYVRPANPQFSLRICAV